MQSTTDPTRRVQTRGTAEPNDHSSSTEPEWEDFASQEELNEFVDAMAAETFREIDEWEAAEKAKRDTARNSF